jgi:hypothetical protein
MHNPGYSNLIQKNILYFKFHSLLNKTVPIVMVARNYGPGAITLYSKVLPGHATVQAVNWWLLTMEGQVRTQVSPCEICGGAK